MSWNTTSPSEVESQAFKNYGTWHPDALTINPITWTTDEAFASSRENKASGLLQPDGSYLFAENYADAVVDNTNKVLVCASVNEDDYPQTLGTVGRYHQYDMAFYYESIRQNIKDRIAAFQ